MNADSSPDNPSGKQKILPGCAVWIFHLLRMFWLTELALLIVVLYGLRAGWSTRQWSDGLFFGAAAQIMSRRNNAVGLERGSFGRIFAAVCRPWQHHGDLPSVVL